MNKNVKMKKWKRVLCAALGSALIVSMMPMSVMADTLATQSPVPITQTTQSSAPIAQTVQNHHRAGSSV